MNKIKRAILRWFDEWGLSTKGAILASKSKNFLLPALLTFILFGILMNLLSSGLTAFKLISVSSFSGTFKIIFNAFLGIFGYNKNFFDWFFTFLIVVIQSVLIGLVFFVYRKNKKNNTNENLSNAGIVAGLAILGAGCPTCGTTLLAPVIGAIFSGSSFALSGTISGLITFLAVIIALLALKKVGLESYVIIKSEKYEKKKKEINDKNR